MHKSVIIDTSVLIALDKIELLPILCKIYKKIILPEAVIKEYGNINLTCISIKKVNSGLVSVLSKDLNLGRGESEVIALAYDCGLPILIDDLKARKIAMDLGLIVSGTIGLLLKAQKMKIIENAIENVLKLKEKGFYISDELIQQIRELN